MVLFERVKAIYSNMAITQADFARSLHLTPATFNGYLKESRQDNLWPLLPRVLALYPQINRDWLYFGEGEMLADGPPKAASAPQDREALEARVRELEAELMEERRLNRRLTERLLDADKPERGVP